MSVVCWVFFVRNTLFHVHSVSPVQAFKVLFQHLSQNSDSGPLDSELDIRTMNYTIKYYNKKKRRNKRKKEWQEVRGVYCIWVVCSFIRLGSLFICPFVQHTLLGWSGDAKVLCMLRHWGVQMKLAYSWAVLVEDNGRGGMFLFLLFLHLHSCFSFFPVPLFHLFYYLFSPFLWETTQNDPQGLTCC